MLTEKQYRMLSLIDEATKWEESERPGKTLVAYFVPRHNHWSNELRTHVTIKGSGDAAIIRGLFAAGLAKQHGPLSKYAAVITETGMVALEEYREANVYVDGKLPA